MALPAVLDGWGESWPVNRAVFEASLARPVVFHAPAVLTSQIERHSVLTVYPRMELLAYGGRLYSLVRSLSYYADVTVTFVGIVSITQSVALAHLDYTSMRCPRWWTQTQLNVFFIRRDHPRSRIMRQFERMYFHRLRQLQRWLRRWLWRKRARRLELSVLVVDARRGGDLAQRAVFGVPELRARVVHFLKGQ